MAQAEIIILNVKEVRKSFGFNNNLINVTFSEKLKTITLTFKNMVSTPGKPELLDLTDKGCDFNFFEEFADSCINGFSGILLSDAEVIKKSEQIFRALQKFIKQQQQFQNFLSRTQQKIKNTMFEGLENTKFFSRELPLKPSMAF